MIKSIMNKLFPPYEPKVTQPKDYTQQILDEIHEFGRREQYKKDLEQHKKDVIETMTQSTFPDYDKKQFDTFLNTMDKFSDDQVLKILAEFMENKESKTIQSMMDQARVTYENATTSTIGPPTPATVPAPMTPSTMTRTLFSAHEAGRMLFIKDKMIQLAEADLIEIIGSFRKHGLIPPESEFYVAGGVFTSLLHGEQIKDIDLFVVNDHMRLFKQPVIESMPRLEQNALAVKFNIDRWSTEYLNNPNIHSTLHISAIAPRSDTLRQRNDINLVCTSYKTREELMDHFDFLHCKVSYDIKENKLFCSKETYDAIINKRLIVANKTKKPKPERIEKFLKRGFVYETTVTV